jgi:hypothetical protein
MLDSRIVFAKIALVSLTLVVWYWLQTTPLFALGLFAALYFVHAIVTLALRTRRVTSRLEQPSSELPVQALEEPAQREDTGRYARLAPQESTRQL